MVSDGDSDSSLLFVEGFVKGVVWIGVGIFPLPLRQDDFSGIFPLCRESSFFGSNFFGLYLFDFYFFGVSFETGEECASCDGDHASWLAWLVACGG